MAKTVWHVGIVIPKRSFLMSCALAAEIGLRPGEVIAEHCYQHEVRIRSSRSLRKRMRRYFFATFDIIIC